jgi:hypothetical protein
MSTLSATPRLRYPTNLERSQPIQRRLVELWVAFAESPELVPFRTMDRELFIVEWQFILTDCVGAEAVARLCRAKGL